MAASADRIGRLGEMHFSVSMLNYRLFRPAFLGEKWPIADFIVEVEDTEERYYFFVQVKSSSSVTNRRTAIPVVANQDSLKRLSSYGAPTYYAFVDVISGKVFLKAIMAGSAFSNKSAVEINESSSQLLRSEVIEFWNKSEILDFKKGFQSEF